MKNVKIFFVAALILLFTVGVFAGKKKFVSGTIYKYSSGSGTYCSLAVVSNLTGLTTTSCGLQAAINDCNGNLYSLYLFNGSTYVPLYFPGC